MKNRNDSPAPEGCTRRLVRARAVLVDLWNGFVEFMTWRFDYIYAGLIFCSVALLLWGVLHSGDDLSEIVQHCEFVGEGHVVLRGFVDEDGNLSLGDNALNHRVTIGVDATSGHDLGNELLDVFVGQRSDSSPLHGEQSNIRVIQVPDLGDVSVHNRIESGLPPRQPVSEFRANDPKDEPGNRPARFLPVFIHIFSTNEKAQ